MKRIRPVLALAAGLYAAQVFGSQVPTLMSYQGRVTDAAGQAIGHTTPVNRLVTFKLYTTSTGGTPVYAESQMATISDGQFSVVIGNGTGVSGLPGPSAPAQQPYIDLSSITTGTLYLGITVDDGTAAADAEISPRQQIVSAAYSLRARVADALADNSLSTTMLTDSSVTTNKIAANGVTTAKIADANITTAKVADHAITAAKLDTATIGLWTPTGSHVYRASGNVGIGQASPGFPLNFANSLGDKIALYGNSGAHYGLGIQSSLLQLYTGNNASSIAFGYGSSESFTETARIRGDGRFGLGTTNPTEKLHVNGGNLLVQNSSQPVATVSTGAANAQLAVATSNGSYSSAAVTNDAVLRASNKLHIQVGNLDAAMSVTAANNVGFGTNNPATKIETVGALQVRDAGVNADNAYAGAVRITRSTGAAQYMNFVRSGSAVWSMGYVPGATTFGIGPGTSNDSAFNPSFRITSSGTVGIGTTSTLARLNVGSVTATWDYYGYLNTDGGHSSNGTRTNEQLSISANANVLAANFWVSSDARLKTALSPTDSASDLETLSQIEVTNYFLKDQSAPTPAQKKAIAQQVEKVFPQAVTQRAGIVPDIYRAGKIQGAWITVANDLKAGDRVRIIAPDFDSVLTIAEANAAAFRVDNAPAATDVFVYGREVPDLKSIDYDAISMLNVSATQELHRRVLTLETELEARDARIDALEKRLKAIEQLLFNAR